MSRSNQQTRAKAVTRNGKPKTPEHARKAGTGSDDDALVTSGKYSARVEHLGSDLPDPPKDFEDSGDADTGAADTDMGQEQSREDVRARGDALRQAAHDAKKPASTNKLPRTARKKLVEAKFGKQRPLTAPRPSPYDVPQSPETTPMRPKTTTKLSKRDISPRKLQTARWKESEVEREKERQKQLDEQLGSSGTRLLPEAGDSRDEEDVAGVQDVEDGQAVAGSSQHNVTETSGSSVEGKKKRGRPRKNGVAMTESVTFDPKEKPGRPRKTESTRSAHSTPMIGTNQSSASDSLRDQRLPGDEAFLQPTSGIFGKKQLRRILQPKQSNLQRRSLRVQQTEARPGSTTAGSSAGNPSRPTAQSRPKQSSQRSQMYINDVSNGTSRYVPNAGSSERVEAAPTKTVNLRKEDVAFEPNQNQDSTNADSEYQPPQEDNVEDIANDVSRDQLQGSHAANSSRKRKVPATASGSQSKQPIKRAKTKESESEDDDSESADEISGENQRLFGYWDSLQKVVRAAKKPQYTQAQANNSDFEGFVSCCERLTTKLKSTVSGVGVESVATQLDALVIEAKDLCSEGTFKHRSAELDWGCDCFALLLPSLVRLLGELVIYFESEGIRASGATQMQLEDLETVLKIAGEIDHIEKEASKNFRPDAKNPIRRKIKQKMIAPLRPIASELERTRRRLVAAVAARKRAEAAARQGAIDDAAQARKDSYDNHIKGLTKEWHTLHHYRIATEGQSRRHLQYSEAYVERDANGQPFSRVSVFGNVRVGPSPGMIAEAESRWPIWTDEQVYHLRQGLKWWADRNPLRHIIVNLCARDEDKVARTVFYGPLRPFNVTDIVVMAARLRQEMIEEYEQNGEEVEEWVKNIPVWTKPHAWGQENEGVRRMRDRREEQEAAVDALQEPEVVDLEDGEDDDA